MAEAIRQRHSDLSAAIAPCLLQRDQIKATLGYQWRDGTAAVTELCSNCNAEVPLNGTRCPKCHEPIGFPNVRAARSDGERDALAKRVQTALDSASIRGTTLELNQFSSEISTSKAVMNRSLGALSSWVNGDSPIFQNYHQQLKHLGRTPHFSVWDKQRASAESTINPFDFEDINFCALTINDRGMDRYGEYSVILDEKFIKHRSSIFEENPFIFNRRHNVIAGTNPPEGYRTVWSKRHELAVAKYHSEINIGMDIRDFASILIKEVGDGSDNDFIEVHIHGPIHRDCIEKVSGPKPQARADRAIWRQAIKSLQKLGAAVEETP